MSKGGVYFLYGYLEFLPTQIGFVTPVYQYDDKLWLESASHGVNEEVIEMPQEYEPLIVRYHGIDDSPLKLQKGDGCKYGFTFRGHLIFGSGKWIVPTLKRLALEAEAWDYAKGPVSQFIREYDPIPDEKFMDYAEDEFGEKVKLLTSQQVTVLKLLLQGKTIKEIGTQHFIPAEVVEEERARIFQTIRVKRMLIKIRNRDSKAVKYVTQQLGKSAAGTKGSKRAVGPVEYKTFKGSEGAKKAQGEGGAQRAQGSEGKGVKGSEDAKEGQRADGKIRSDNPSRKSREL